MAYPDKGATEAAFSEVTKNTPKVVQSTKAKFGAARAQKQTVAIALSKARKASSGSSMKPQRPKSYYAARKYSKV